jgi:hypothetical protein
MRALYLLLLLLGVLVAMWLLSLAVMYRLGVSFRAPR